MDVVTANCPVCERPSQIRYLGEHDMSLVDCRRCGKFKVSGSAEILLVQPATAGSKTTSDVIKASVGHWLRDQQRFTSRPTLLSEKITKLRETPYFPKIGEQLDLLVRHIGKHVDAPGHQYELSCDDHQYIVGSRNPLGVKALVQHLKETGLLEVSINVGNGADDAYVVSLTVKGWLHLEDIQKNNHQGKKAFIAMPFNKPDLDDEWLPALRQTVDETGFNLERVDDNPEAGLIDTRMRLQIKAARFLLVELTHANNGAYWEAGMAEGRDIPVIYLCKKDIKPHFDVEHSFRIPWDPNDFSPALDTLKATIRNSLPDARPEPD